MSRACRSCKVITDETACPICKGTDLSDDYSGLLIILDPEGSQLATKMEIEKEGRYALRIR
ncbi:MAG: DNA-directed RNA polymerase subunit E'' [Candidatus Bathyarchaeota archaeon]|jgi:DNA-directed RNA polymerase subunit E"|nr:DNA-directed RNA polymerase subunit E'' [Candidatus Bathyarchaeota archaeon]